MFSIAKAQADPIEKVIEIRLDIPSAELLSKPGDKPYRVGEKPYIRMTVKNQSDHQIRVRVLDSFYQNRPRLSKNGHIVPYSKGIPALINSKDTDPHFMRGGGAIELAPYSSAELPELDLSDWYGALEPGVYQLVNRYRPEMYGYWTADCDQLVFEVVKHQ